MLFDLNDIKKGFAPSITLVGGAGLSAAPSELSTVLASIKPVTPYWTRGKCSTHVMLEALAAIAVKPYLTFSTWGLTEKPLRKILEMKNAGAIKGITAVLDRRVTTNSPKAVSLMESMADVFAYRDVHAKIYLLDGEKEKITILASHNLTNNSKLEAGCIFNIPEVFEGYKELLSNVIKESNKSR
jgi:hypothetical protein